MIALTKSRRRMAFPKAQLRDLPLQLQRANNGLPATYMNLSVELIVQPDAEDVVGEMCVRGGLSAGHRVNRGYWG